MVDLKVKIVNVLNDSQRVSTCADIWTNKGMSSLSIGFASSPTPRALIKILCFLLPPLWILGTSVIGFCREACTLLLASRRASGVSEGTDPDQEGKLDVRENQCSRDMTDTIYTQKKIALIGQSPTSTWRLGSAQLQSHVAKNFSGCNVC